MTLLTDHEITAILGAEETAERLVASRSRQALALTRAVVFLPRDGVQLDRHMRLCVERATAERYRVIGLTFDPRAVIGLAEEHLVDVVLAAVRWRLGDFDEVESAIAALGVQLDVIRDLVQPARRRVNVDPVVARLAALGVEAGVIAEAVGIPVEAVRLALVRTQAGEHRRPADGHPWRPRAR